MDKNERILSHLNSLIERYPELRVCEESICKAVILLSNCFSSGHKLLIAGNGGSCADAEHIVGELMKGFMKQRKCPEEFADKLKSIDPNRGSELAEKLQGGLPAIALSNNQSLNTAYINDIPDSGPFIFAEQVYGYGKEGDVLLCISTSGNSKNIMNAVVVAKAKGLSIIGLTGEDGGELAKSSDSVIKAPSKETFIVQEYHLPIYHCICLMLEEKFFD